MKTLETGNQTPEKKEMLKIRGIEIKDKLAGLSGMSVDSLHGDIEDTKGVILDVDTNKGHYEVVTLFANYLTERAKYNNEGKPQWQLTDLKLINSSARYGATFELTELDDTVTHQLSKAIQKRFIDEKGELKL